MADDPKRILPLYGEEPEPASEWEQALFEASTVEEVQQLRVRFPKEYEISSGDVAGTSDDNGRRSEEVNEVDVGDD